MPREKPPKPPIDFLKEAKKRGKIIDYDRMVQSNNEDARYINPQMDFRKIGKDHFEKMESFYKDWEDLNDDPYDEINLQRSKKEISSFSDKDLLDAYEHSNETFWSRDGSREFYKAVLGEVIKRFTGR